MFDPKKFDAGRLDTALTASSTTITKGDALSFSSGYVQRATSSDAVIHAVAMEDIVTAGGAHTPLSIVWTHGVEFIGDTANNTAQSLVGTSIDLTNHTTLNDGASSTDVFVVRGIVGAAADKKVRGHFVPKVS